MYICLITVVFSQTVVVLFSEIINTGEFVFAKLTALVGYESR